jgi:SAM-dependent methyltransferase
MNSLPVNTYVIRGGVEGRERQRVLARVMWPTTRVLFSELRLASTARCLDWGCGGGDVTTSLAQMLPRGLAVGIDIDEVKLGLGRTEAARAGVTNVEFRVGDVREPLTDADSFDLVYARFLLTHLPDPTTVLSHMVAALSPGGTLVVEDIDFSGHFCEPHSPAFWRYVELYTQVVRDRGCDPNIGPRLPGLLRSVGLTQVAMRVVQPAGFDGEVKLVGPITLESIADAVLAAGLSTIDDLNRTVDQLYQFANTEGTVLSLPRIVQSWGVRPGHR